MDGRVGSPAPQPIQPDIVQAPAVEEEEEYGPEISVDVYGNYFNSEVKDVRRDGLDESILQSGHKEKQELATTTTEGFDTRGDVAMHRLGERKTLTRSTSVGTGSGMLSSVARNQPNPETNNEHHPAPNMLTANRSAIVNRNRPNLAASQHHLPGSAGKPFKRVNSDGENARRQAIQSVLSASGSQTSRPSSSFQGVTSQMLGAGLSNVGGDSSQVGRFRNMSDQNSVASAVGVPQGNAVRAGGERPSISAGIGNQEVEDLKRQLARVRRHMSTYSSFVYVIAHSAELCYTALEGEQGEGGKVIESDAGSLAISG